MPLWILNPAMLKAAKWPSQTDDPPSDAPPLEGAADVQRQAVAPPPDSEIIMTCAKCGWSGPVPAQAAEPVCCGWPLEVGEASGPLSNGGADCR